MYVVCRCAAQLVGRNEQQLQHPIQRLLTDMMEGNAKHSELNDDYQDLLYQVRLPCSMSHSFQIYEHDSFYTLQSGCTLFKTSIFAPQHGSRPTLAISLREFLV